MPKGKEHGSSWLPVRGQLKCHAWHATILRINRVFGRVANGTALPLTPRQAESFRALRLELPHHLDQPFQIFRPREAVVAVLDQGEHDIVLREARGQIDGVVPWDIWVLHTLQNAYRTPGLDHAAEQKVAAPLLDESSRDRIGFAVLGGSRPDTLFLDFLFQLRREALPHQHL